MFACSGTVDDDLFWIACMHFEVQRKQRCWLFFMSGHFLCVCLYYVPCTSFCFAVANWSSRGSVCICGQDGWSGLSRCTLEERKTKVNRITADFFFPQHFCFIHENMADHFSLTPADICERFTWAFSCPSHLIFLSFYFTPFVFCLVWLGFVFLLEDSGLSSSREAKYGRTHTQMHTITHGHVVTKLHCNKYYYYYWFDSVVSFWKAFFH